MKNLGKIVLLISVMLVSLGSLAFASAAQYRISVTLEDAHTQEQLKNATCLIDQTLEWGNAQSIWSCRFNKEETAKTKMFDADTIGYSYEEQASYVEFTFSSGSELGKFLLSGLAMDGRNLKGKNTLNHTFFKSRVRVTPQISLVDSEKEQLLSLKFEFLEYVDN